VILPLTVYTNDNNMQSKGDKEKSNTQYFYMGSSNSTYYIEFLINILNFNVVNTI